jgi:hypothetical protein
VNFSLDIYFSHSGGWFLYPLGGVSVLAWQKCPVQKQQKKRGSRLKGSRVGKFWVSSGSVAAKPIKANAANKPNRIG